MQGGVEWRLPVRLSRCRTRLDDHTGSGAVRARAERATVPWWEFRRVMMAWWALARSSDRGRGPAGVEFVQVPTQAVDRPGAFTDQGFACVDQESDLAVRAVQLRGGQAGFPQRGACHRLSVEQVGFSPPGHAAAALGPGTTGKLVAAGGGSG